MPNELTTTRRPATAQVARVSQPNYLTPAVMSGMGFISRRSANAEGYGGSDTALRSIDSILLQAKIEPLRVLTYLPDLIPEVGKADWNGLRLGCGPDAVRLKAMDKSRNGTDVKEMPDGTAAIQDLFNNLPPQVGSFRNALSQNFLMAQYSGMAAVEAVPGRRNEGVAQIWPIDTLTTRFMVDPADGLAKLWQRRKVITGSAGARTYGGYIKLPEDRTFHTSMDGFPDDPYGRAPRASLLMPVLEMTAFMKDLLLAWHRVGTPKWDVGFDYEMHAKIAREQLGMSTREEITAYVEEQFDNAVAMFSNLQADDTFFHDIKSTVGVNGSGGKWPDTDKIYNILRWRMIMALKEMPTLMGVVEGNTETWSSVDWQIYAKGLETLVEIAAAPLIKAAQLHLQLLGMPYYVVAEYAPVRANQRMVDAQAEQIEIDNELQKVWAGFQTQDEASMRVTGSAAIAPMDMEALGAKKPPTPTGQTVGGKGPSKAN